MKELRVKADTKNLLQVQSFINDQLEEYDCPMLTQTSIGIAVEELFVNICHYAYAPAAGDAVIRVGMHEDPLSVEISFIDSGIPYNPLEKPDPNTTLSAKQRQIGGLGIFMVKKSMDSMTYEYKDGKNILTIGKYLK